MKNTPQIFKNDLFELAVKMGNGEWVFDVEMVAKSLGIVDNKNNKSYVRWNRVNSYLPKSSPEVAKGDFIPESLVYKLAFKASNDIAEQFQDWLAIDVIPKIRKTGGYVANEELFLETYLPYADDTTKLLFKTTLETVRNQNKIIEEQKKEIEYKESVIINLVDEVTLAEKRQILNKVVRMGGGQQTRDRWNALYNQFEMKYHINLKKRFETYNTNNKPKLKNKLDYIDLVMNKIPELYEIAVKLFENDVKKLVDELYELQKNKKDA